MSPSAGQPIEHFWREGMSDDDCAKMYMRILVSAQHAISLGLFCEWLESFVGAWNATHDADTAQQAGIIEWDM
jgi:hypothetical protein